MNRNEASGSNCFFIALDDLKAEITPGLIFGYFDLIMAAFEKNSFITYKAILDNYSLYFLNPITNYIFKFPTYQSEILCRRYGLTDGEFFTYDEIGERLSLSAEDVREYEKTLLPKMKRLFKDIVYTSRKEQNKEETQSSIEYGKIFEELLRQELKHYNTRRDSEYDYLFGNILNSCRFDEPVDYDLKIAEMKCDKEVKKALFDEGVSTVRDLITIDDISLWEKSFILDNIKSQYVFLRIKNLQRKSRMRRYKLDDESIFDKQGEYLITRTHLTGPEKYELLRKGFFFVSDVIEYYDFLASYNPDYDYKLNIWRKERKVLKELLMYSQPIMCIKMSKALQTILKEKELKSINDIRLREDAFKGIVREEVNQLLLDVDEAVNLVQR